MHSRPVSAYKPLVVDPTQNTSFQLTVLGGLMRACHCYFLFVNLVRQALKWQATYRLSHF